MSQSRFDTRKDQVNAALHQRGPGSKRERKKKYLQMRGKARNGTLPSGSGEDTRQRRRELPRDENPNKVNKRQAMRQNKTAGMWTTENQAENPMKRKGLKSKREKLY